MSFPNVVNQYQAPAVPGDFAGANPKANVPAPDFQFTAGAAGCNAGVFAWADVNGRCLNTAASGVPTGFVHRNGQALITAWLGEASMTIQSGTNMALMSSGDFWVKAAGGVAAVVGQKVFAKLADGTITTGAAGATIAGYVETKWFVTTACASGELFIMSNWV